MSRSLILILALAGTTAYGQLQENEVALPAPSPEATYVIHFGFNRHDLSSTARAIVGSAATDIRQQNPKRVLITGHADQVGSEEYNIRLSRARAKSVHDDLRRLGVRQDIMHLDWKGSYSPVVTHPNPIEEPRNRRVTISFE